MKFRRIGAKLKKNCIICSKIFKLDIVQPQWFPFDPSTVLSEWDERRNMILDLSSKALKPWPQTMPHPEKRQFLSSFKRYNKNSKMTYHQGKINKFFLI